MPNYYKIMRIPTKIKTGVAGARTLYREKLTDSIIELIKLLTQHECDIVVLKDPLYIVRKSKPDTRFSHLAVQFFMFTKIYFNKQRDGKTYFMLENEEGDLSRSDEMSIDELEGVYKAVLDTVKAE